MAKKKVSLKALSLKMEKTSWPTKEKSYLNIL